MKIKNIKEEIKNLNGESLSDKLLSVDNLIEQVKREKDVKGLLLALNEAKNKAIDSLTYLKVIEDGCFVRLEKETNNAGKFMDAIDLISKVRNEKEINDEDLEQLKTGVLLSSFNPYVKAMVLQRLIKNK